MKGRNLSLGLIFIALGTLWILGNMEIINFSVFDIMRSFFNLWPLILIIIGINISIKNNTLKTILWILFIVIVIGYSFYINDSSYEKSRYVEEEVVEMNEDTIKGKLNLDLGATKYDVVSKDNENNLAYIKSNKNYQIKESLNNSSQILTISNDLSHSFSDDNKLNVNINNNIIWSIDIDTGASNGELNLENVKVQNLDLDMGAGKIDAKLGSLNNTTYINIESGASKIVLNIPEDAGLKIEMDGALNSTNIDDLNLVQNADDILVSQDYAEKETKFDVKVDMGVGSFKINRY
ncbi:LiaF transmembrane domain-containing protein [Senegalia massiliensis]|uniref:LiaF transmembrane domain-containing protein n=1 Tax=Senegalia massiliensis TaxID=1720316 RepID=A0A845QY30_9CLOT|nr:DUF5668 domain-containing protein [Senegalia massiliensis]NBI07171.1 hypothetical protein [Senegalia massiliensis]